VGTGICTETARRQWRESEPEIGGKVLWRGRSSTGYDDAVIAFKYRLNAYFSDGLELMRRYDRELTWDNVANWLIGCYSWVY